ESKSKVRYSRDKPIVAKVSTNVSTYSVSPDVAELKDMVKALLLDKKVQNQSPAPVKAVVENEPEATKDTVNPTNNENTKDVQPQAVQSESSVLISKPVTSPISEPVITPVSARNPKASIPYPSRRNDERNREKANNQIEKFYQIFKDMSFKIRFADALILMPKFATTLKALIRNKEKLSEMARTPLNEHCYAVLLKKLPEKIRRPRQVSDSILSLPDLTPTCITLELADRSISRSVGVTEDVYVKVGSFHFLADFVVVDFDADPRVPLILERSFLKTGRALIDVFKEGDILLLEAFLNDDPLLPPLNQRNYLPKVRKKLKICEAKSDKSLVDEPLVVELKVLP
nr:reverse transcriptase domain-containing protein [Tanacetum cinerariifolium]